MKKILAMFAAVACAAVLSACNDQKAESKTQADESLNKVKAAGEFVLGLDDSFPPMGFRDKDNNIVGFDIDLATEVCARLGVKLKTQPISWDAKEQELNTGKIDCIWNGMSVDSARAKAMNLSDPYLKNRMIFTVKDKSLASLAALAGKKIRSCWMPPKRARPPRKSSRLTTTRRRSWIWTRAVWMPCSWTKSWPSTGL